MMAPDVPDRPHELSPEQPGRAAARAVARDHLEEGRRLLRQAAEEVEAGELNAARGGDCQLSADAAMIRRAVTAEDAALHAAMTRSRQR